MAETTVGSLKVDVIPNMDAFSRMFEMAGLRTIETVTYERDEDGAVSKMVTTTEYVRIDS